MYALWRRGGAAVRSCSRGGWRGSDVCEHVQDTPYVYFIGLRHTDAVDRRAGTTLLESGHTGPILEYQMSAVQGPHHLLAPSPTWITICR